MQPVEAQQGVSTKSLLFNSLRVYLNNKNRLQPIIGLGSIIECVKADTQNREVFYLCEVCVCRLSKADMRCHIMGSLHRYNYIKVWHPDLVSAWQETSDLSKLARPLMEMATVLEGKEGPGEVQWFEVEDAVYQKLATRSENAAEPLITILKDGQGQGEPERYSETTSVQLEHHLIQSQRIVLLSQNQERPSTKSLETSAETNESVAFIKSQGWLENASPEPTVLSENSDSFLDGYTGTTPLIGLFRMVECRSEDGHTCCFLCHCCRIRSKRKDIIDHLTKSSHLVNYLMEILPDKVEVMMADINNDYPLLQSLARKVEQEEGRGELQVLNPPASLCSLLTGKSYHWCIKMLCNGWVHTDIQKRKIAVKGPSVNKTSNEVMPEKCDVLSQWSKTLTTKRKKRKTRKGTNPVFNVSMPLTKGSMLLERTSFSTDSLPVSPAYSPSADLDLSPLPESQSECCELDYDTGSLEINHAEHASQLQHDLYSGDADAGQYMEPERNVTVTRYQEGHGYFNDNEHCNQSENVTATKYRKVYGENNYTGQYGYQARPSEMFYNEVQNESLQTQTEWLSPAVSYTQDLSSYNAYYYYQQLQQNQSMVQGHSSLLTGSVGQHGVSGEVAAQSDAAWINVHPCFGDPRAHSGSIAPEPTVTFLEIEQRRMPTYMGVHHWS